MLNSLDEVYEKLIKGIRSCPEFPENVLIHIGETDSRKSEMSLVVDLNLSRSSKNICGGFNKSYNADLFYQVVAQTDNQKRNVFKMLEHISEFLSKNSENFGINIFDILASPKLLGKNNNGLDVFRTKFLIR